MVDKQEKGTKRKRDKLNHDAPTLTSRKKSGGATHSSSPNSPRLSAAPGRINDLVRIIDLGGCPRCGGTDCHGNGGDGPDRKYTCEGCGNRFDGSDQELSQSTYVNQTFEGKRKLQAMFRDAYEQIEAEDMAADALEFQRKMTAMRGQLRAKRRNISRLLGISLDEDGVNQSDQKAKTDKIVEETNETEETTPDANPLRAAIIHLRRETPKLERAVNKLLSNCPNNSQHAIGKVTGAAENYLDQQQHMLAEQEETSSHVDVVSASPSSFSSDSGAKYILASTILQEEGDEIEIYEKCSGGRT